MERKWNIFNVVEKEKYHNLVCQILSSKILPNSADFIKEKLGTIVSEVLKREWPQNWKNFHEIYFVAVYFIYFKLGKFFIRIT